MRADSAYYTHDVIAAASRAGARFSVTVRMNSAVITAISQIGVGLDRVPERDLGRRRTTVHHDAEVPFTAFTSRRKADHVSARLILRRVKRLNQETGPRLSAT